MYFSWNHRGFWVRLRECHFQSTFFRHLMQSLSFQNKTKTKNTTRGIDLTNVTNSFGSNGGWSRSHGKSRWWNKKDLVGLLSILIFTPTSILSGRKKVQIFLDKTDFFHSNWYVIIYLHTYLQLQAYMYSEIEYYMIKGLERGLEKPFVFIYFFRWS